MGYDIHRAMRRLTKPRFLAAYLIIPLVFVTAATGKRQFRLGLPFVGAGLLIRLWANGYVGHQKVNKSGGVKIGHLITAGPYAYVRHPLYVGTFLLSLGFCIIAGRWLLGLVALSALVAVYQYKMDEEERTIEEEWGEEFLRYRQAVSRWLPIHRSYPYPHGKWSWLGIQASKEWKTVLWVLVALIALYLRREMGQGHALFTPPHAARQELLLGLAVVLMVTDVCVELSIRRTKQMVGAGGRQS